MVYDFNYYLFLLVIIISCISFLWVRRENKELKIYVIPFAVFITIYAGVGVAWSNTDITYLMYYCVWLVAFSFSLKWIVKKKNYAINRFSCETSFFEKKGKWFIVSYIFLLLMQLAIEGKLNLLINPPQPDLRSAFDGTEIGGSGLIYLAKLVIYPFYLASLIRYKDRLFFLLILLFFPFYVQYVESAYIARSGVVAYLLIYLAIIYIYRPALRKRLVVSTLIAIPFFLVALSWYTYARLGMDFSLNLTDAVSELLYQETSYTRHFNLLMAKEWDSSLMYDYFEWLFTLPLPGFLKGSSNDFFFNAIFSERLYGVYRGEMGFSVYLPSVVNESIFIFGPLLYVIHAIILGIFVGIIYRMFKYKEEYILFLYCSIYISSVLARAGTFSIYSIYLKGLLVYFIVRAFFIKPIKHG